jgi:hypothetical protein
VKAIGTVLRSFLFVMFSAPEDFTILFSKIDLSDGFWRMSVAPSDRYKFAFTVPGSCPPLLAIPDAPQMGWVNSPAYFTVATDSGCTLVYTLLQQLSHQSHTQPHPLEHHFFPAIMPARFNMQCQGIETYEASTLDEFPFLLRVYMDDFLKGVAVPRLPASILRMLTRATLHSIHAIFPPPAVTGHLHGKDSISEKKLLRGDGQWHYQKTLLVIAFDGDSRTVRLPHDCAQQYIADIELALQQSFIPFKRFQHLHGILQSVGQILPPLRGFMTPLKRVLGRHPEPTTVGLGQHSELREIFRHSLLLISSLEGPTKGIMDPVLKSHQAVK